MEALNYFLGKEIEKEASADQQRAEKTVVGPQEGQLKTELGPS